MKSNKLTNDVFQIETSSFNFLGIYQTKINGLYIIETLNQLKKGHKDFNGSKLLRRFVFC